jgi:cytochrome c oxidase cbb3-type subunit 4
MNPFWGQLAGIVTVILMVTFIAIWVWAWRPHHRRTFDRLARLPLADDADRETGA